MSARFGDSAVESALMLKALCDRLARVVKTLKPSGPIGWSMDVVP